MELVGYSMNKKQAEKIALRLLNHKGKTPNKDLLQ